MGVDLTSAEGRALYGLLAETAQDIVLKTDRRGFIIHATPAIERLGFALPHMLFGPHLAELALPGHADRLLVALHAALAGDRAAHRVEFAARMAARDEEWFEIALSPLADHRDRPCGALGIMRSIDERRMLEEELFAAAMTDPLTGLTNRQAFLAMLECLVASGREASLALFSVDHFKAINLRHGQLAGDRLLVAFADFLRGALRAGDTISRIGNQRFAVILPDTDQQRAEAVCLRTLAALAELTRVRAPTGLPVTASVGITVLGGSLDATLRQAELALFFARARGRNRVERYASEKPVRAA